MILASSILSSCGEFFTKHPGILLVLLGVAGEVAFDWKDIKGPWAWAKKTSAILLVLGLAMEIREAATSDNETALLLRNVEVLRKSNLELEAKLAWRTITPNQKGKLVGLLGPEPKGGRVVVEFQSSDPEASNFAKQINAVLQACKFESVFNPAMIVFKDVTPSGLWLSVKNTADVPSRAGLIFKSFDAVGMTMIPESKPEKDSDFVRIFVGTKPNLAP